MKKQIKERKYMIGQEVTLDDINKLKNSLYEKAYQSIMNSDKTTDKKQVLDTTEYRQKRYWILKNVKFTIKQIPDSIKMKGVNDYVK